MTNNKVVGTGKEREAIAKLYEQGAIDVKRAPSSLGIFDIWAIFPDKLLLVQVKETKFMLTFEKLKQEIKAVQVPPYCFKALWVWYSYRPRRINKTKANFKGWVFHNL